MPSSIYEPINGKEARLVLKKSVNNQIDTNRDMSLFKEGNAFHRIEMCYALTVTCYPADCPVPEMEIIEAINAPGLTTKEREEIEKTKDNVKLIDTKIEKLHNQIAKLLAMKNQVQPVIEIEEIHSAGNIPDELRKEFDLPVPQIVSTPLIDGTTKKQEVFVQVK